MRFLIVTDLYPPYHSGGSGIYAYELAQETAKRGHQVDVVHSMDCFKTKGRDPDPGHWPNHPAVAVHTVESKFSTLSAGLSLAVGQPVAGRGRLKRLFAGDYDVIHYHTIHHLGGPSLFELGEAVKVATLHTYWLFCPTSFLVRNRRERCTRKTCLRCTVIHYRNPPQLWRFTPVLERALRELDLILSPSQFVRDLHIRELGELPIECLPYYAPGVRESLRNDTPPPYLRDYIQDGRKYFLYVGRLTHLKGVHVLIRAFRSCEARHLLVVGDGPDSKQLRQLAGDQERIHFLGHQPRERLDEIYRHAGALIVPSLCDEIFGLVVVEAMAHGIPLIVHRAGALTGLVQSNNAGIVYHDEEELRHALTEFDESSPAVREYAVNARRAARTRYTRERHMDRYFHLVGDLIQSRS